VTKDFTVLFETAGRPVRVKCRFNYVGKYRSVFTTHDGRKLAARQVKGGQTTLLEAGQEVVIEGRCQGLKDDEVVFSRCAIVR
jgi:hypothetical protein